MGQLLNRALVFISDFLQAMLHSITLLLTTPIATAIVYIHRLRSLLVLLTVARWRALPPRMHLWLGFLLRDETWRCRTCVIVLIIVATLLRSAASVTTLLWFINKDLVLAFPKVTSCIMPNWASFGWGMHGSHLWMTLITHTCNRWFSSNCGGRRRRFSARLIHDKWGIGLQGVPSIAVVLIRAIVSCFWLLLLSVAMVVIRPVGGVLGELSWRASVTLPVLGLHRLWGCNSSWLVLLPLSKNTPCVQLSCHVGTSSVILGVGSLQALTILHLFFLLCFQILLVSDEIF